MKPPLSSGAQNINS